MGKSRQFGGSVEFLDRKPKGESVREKVILDFIKIRNLSL